MLVLKRLCKAMTFQPGLFTEASFLKLQIPWVPLI
jgi:hypothetical protein